MSVKKGRTYLIKYELRIPGGRFGSNEVGFAACKGGNEEKLQNHIKLMIGSHEVGFAACNGGNV